MSFSTGQTFQLLSALSRAGFSEQDVVRFGQATGLLRRSPDLLGIRDVLDGYSEIVPGEHILKLDEKSWELCGKDPGNGHSYVPLTAYRLMKALEYAGFSPEDVTRLGQFKDLAAICSILEGRSKITPNHHTVDLDVEPGFNTNLYIGMDHMVDHIEGGKIVFDPARFVCHLVDGQDRGGGLLPRTIKDRLKGRTVYNATLLRFFLRYPRLIPPECRNQYTVFWGTTYKYIDGEFVLCLFHRGGGTWSFDKVRLDGREKLGKRYPALIAA